MLPSSKIAAKDPAKHHIMQVRPLVPSQGIIGLEVSVVP